MKNACIVGYGSIGVIHDYALQQTENARLYAVCDINENCLREFKDKIVTYTDFDTMLADDKIDSVHICTPHYTHFYMAKNALNHGKFVVLEKPAVMTREELNELLLLPNNDKIAVVFQNRLNPCVIKLKKLLQSGNFGEIISAKAVLAWHRDMNYYNHDSWRGRLATEGGGVMINQAIHTLDMISYLLGNIESVKANVFNYSLPEIEVEDTCCAYLKLKNDICCIFFATNANGENDAPEIEIHTEKAKFLYKDDKLTVNNELIECDSVPTIGKECWGNGHKKLIVNIYDKNTFFGVNDIKNTMDALFAVYESSANEGKEISLNI